MKNALKVLGIIALAAIIGFSMAACSKASSNAAASGNSAAASTGLSGTSNDKLIDDFEKIIDELVELTRKVMDGDAAAAIQLEALEEKGNIIVEEFGKRGEDNFTEAQKQRIDDISMKVMTLF